MLRRSEVVGFVRRGKQRVIALWSEAREGKAEKERKKKKEKNRLVRTRP